jgi:hypothetical protein
VQFGIENTEKTMPKNKRQHYISNFFLKRFAVPNSLHGSKYDKLSIYRLDKTNNSIWINDTENCAYENYYYSFIEKDGKLNHQIEFAFAHLEDSCSQILLEIDEIIDVFKRTMVVKELTKDKIDAIIFFLFISMVRIPHVFGKMRTQIEQLELEKSKEYNYEPSDIWIKNSAIQMLSKLTNPSESKIYGLLKKKHFSLIYCRKSQKSFITADTPVILCNNLGPNGLIHIETEVYFPISSQICIVLQDNIPEAYIIYIEDISFIDEINKSIYNQSTRYVYGNSKEILASLIPNST